ncbi:MAG: hypothetical protein EU549_00420 [Promethearchaeota archaeon]|nr:MAG: hypothetical protein EU549_00420 [Candidatus Lokiarchaeota archaeon]
MNFINAIKKILSFSFIKSQYLTIAEIINIGSSYIYILIATNNFIESLIGYSSINITLFNNISLISLLGFNYMIIRFKNELREEFPNLFSIISISLILSILLTIASSFILLALNIGINYIPNISEYVIYLIFIIIYCSSLTIGKLFDAQSISDSKNHLVMIRCLISGFLKIFFLFIYTFFTLDLSNHILIIIYAISISLGDFIIFIIFKYSKKINIEYKTNITLKEEIRIFFSKNNVSSKKYAFLNYASDIISRIPNFLFPIIVGAVFGEAEAAYFYITWMVGNFIMMVYVSVSHTIIVEQTKESLKKEKSTSNLIISSILISILISIIIILFRDFILGLFGESYAQQDLLLIIILITSNIVGILYIIAAFLRLNLKSSQLLILFLISSILSVIIETIFLYFIKDINTIGYSWLIANLIALTYGIYIVYKNKYF